MKENSIFSKAEEVLDVFKTVKDNNIGTIFAIAMTRRFGMSWVNRIFPSPNDAPAPTKKKKKEKGTPFDGMEEAK